MHCIDEWTGEEVFWGLESRVGRVWRTGDEALRGFVLFRAVDQKLVEWSVSWCPGPGKVLLSPIHEDLELRV